MLIRKYDVQGQEQTTSLTDFSTNCLDTNHRLVVSRSLMCADSFLILSHKF